MHGALVLLVLAAEPYTVKDLQALAEQGGWQELLAHLGDVRPSDRQAEWNKLLEQAGVGFLGDIDRAREHYAAVVAAEELLTTYPTLKKSRAYLDKRAAVGLKGFQECFSSSYDSPACSKQLLSFVEADPSNHALAVDAAKLARRRGTPEAAARLFKLAAADPADAKLCGDSDLREAALMALRGPDGAAAKEGRGLAFGRCWAELQPAMMAELGSGGSGFARNACKELDERKALSRFQQALCKDLTKG